MPRTRCCMSYTRTLAGSRPSGSPATSGSADSIEGTQCIMSSDLPLARRKAAMRSQRTIGLHMTLDSSHSYPCSQPSLKQPCRAGGIPVRSQTWSAVGLYQSKCLNKACHLLLMQLDCTAILLLHARVSEESSRQRTVASQRLLDWSQT